MSLLLLRDSHLMTISAKFKKTFLTPSDVSSAFVSSKQKGTPFSICLAVFDIILIINIAFFVPVSMTKTGLYLLDFWYDSVLVVYEGAQNIFFYLNYFVAFYHSVYPSRWSTAVIKHHQSEIKDIINNYNVKKSW